MTLSKTEWICFSLGDRGQFLFVIQRCDGMRRVEEEIGIKLSRQLGAAVVAPPLRVRPIDDTNEPLEPVLLHLAARFAVAVPLPHINQKAAKTSVVGDYLPAVFARRIDVHDFHLTAPFSRGGHSAVVGAASDNGDVLEMLSAQLTQVDLDAQHAHVCRASPELVKRHIYVLLLV